MFFEKLFTIKITLYIDTYNTTLFFFILLLLFYLLSVSFRVYSYKYQVVRVEQMVLQMCLRSVICSVEKKVNF